MNAKMNLSVRLFAGLLMVWIGYSCGPRRNVTTQPESQRIYSEIRKVHKIPTGFDVDYLKNLDYSPDNDTVCVLEFWEYDSGSYAFAAWNRSDTIWGSSKELRKNQYMRFGIASFPLYMMKLIWEWNTDELKKEEEENPFPDIERELIYATRIVFNERKHWITTFHFLDFFKEGRDGSLFYWKN